MFKRIPLSYIKFLISTLIGCCFFYAPSNAGAWGTKYSFSDGKKAETGYFLRDYTTSASIFEYLSGEKDRNFALWNNQLGMIYLKQGLYERSEDSFLKAHYLMNNIAAFKELEKKAISLRGSESEKAYKGDPYEKVFNSLYVALLLYSRGDLDNALAACKTGILSDSDVRADMYKSDVAILYLLASRILLVRGNTVSSHDYFGKAREAYSLTWPSNRPLVGEEQLWRTYLGLKKDELKKLAASRNSNAARNPSLWDINREIGYIDGCIKRLEDQREMNNAAIDLAPLDAFLDLKNNTLFVLSLGKGPVKYQFGKYGQYAAFAYRRQRVNSIEITVDGKRVDTAQKFIVTDVSFQAVTRGGREMDRILNGKAEFRETASGIAAGCGGVSRDITKLASSRAKFDPGFDGSDAYTVGAVLDTVSDIIGKIGEVANPSADIRHWSLLPAEILILSAYMTPGEHNVKIDCYDNNGLIIPSMSSSEIISIKNEVNNVIFKSLGEEITHPGKDEDHGTVLFSFCSSGDVFTPTGIIIEEIDQYKDLDRKPSEKIYLSYSRTNDGAFAAKRAFPRGTYRISSLLVRTAGPGAETLIPCSMLLDIPPGTVSYAGRIMIDFPGETPVSIMDLRDGDVPSFKSAYKELNDVNIDTNLFY
ncbi:MAG: hypothetical protein HQL30_12395 [Candidatus Omnitrophica bacterium]|nr:hypothetical protein [Candidatus Omnitrophota bacterium]